MLLKKAIVVHSGGFDSSVCLHLAKEKHGAENILSLSFSYQQRHRAELACAVRISSDWGIDHTVVDIRCLASLTQDSLTDAEIPVEWEMGREPSCLVVGRNGLMARLAAIHAAHLGAHYIYMGVMEEEARLVGYRDCSRRYMDLMEQILRIDLNDPAFSIRTPLVSCSLEQVITMAYERGILDYLLESTISCYEGLPASGCMRCPSCIHKHRALVAFQQSHPRLAAAP